MRDIMVTRRNKGLKNGTIPPKTGCLYGTSMLNVKTLLFYKSVFSTALDSCEINVSATTKPMTLSASSLKRQGICRWNIKASSLDDKLEIVFQPLMLGTFVDVSINVLLVHISFAIFFPVPCFSWLIQKNCQIMIELCRAS